MLWCGSAVYGAVDVAVQRGVVGVAVQHGAISVSAPCTSALLHRVWLRIAAAVQALFECLESRDIVTLLYALLVEAQVPSWLLLHPVEAAGANPVDCRSY